MPDHYAIDFGTTNTVIASDREGSVSVVPLAEVMADRIRTPVVPSAVYFREQGGVEIGQNAVDQNVLGMQPQFVQGFKPYLGRQSHRSVAERGRTGISARKAAE